MIAASLFPGQGAQYVGMGKDFYEYSSLVRERFEEAEDALDCKLKELLFEGPQEKLTETKNSQIAIYLMSCALNDLLKKDFPQYQPQFFAGLSLGEYSALYAAGRLGFVEGLKLVNQRAILMHFACEENKGSMIAVIGPDIEAVKEELKPYEGQVWLANYNSPGQIVLSGKEVALTSIGHKLKDKGARKVIPLDVHGAFHSGLMEKAQKVLTPFIEKTAFLDSPFPIVSNVSAELETDNERIKQLLSRQVVEPVLWANSMQTLKEAGVEFYLEIGCGNTLKNLCKRNLPGSLALNIDKVADLELLDKQLNSTPSR